MPIPPQGTVTFLFTDFRGSTRLWEEYPEQMRPTLERHDRLLRSIVEERNYDRRPEGLQIVIPLLEQKRAQKTL